MGNTRQWTRDRYEGHPDYHAGSAWQDALRDAHCRIGRVTFKRRASSRILTEFNVTTNRLLRSLGRKEETRS